MSRSFTVLAEILNAKTDYENGIEFGPSKMNVPKNMKTLTKESATWFLNKGLKLNKNHRNADLVKDACYSFLSNTEELTNDIAKRKVAAA